MDKYLIPRARLKTDSSQPKERKSKQEQVTIESLSRVVVIDQVVKLKEKLTNKTSSPKEIIGVLNELEKRTPSKDVLIETKIGHSVNKLRKHENHDVSRLAGVVLKKWKGFYREINARQPLEVNADLRTRRFREKSRNFFAQAMNVEITLPLVTDLERTIYATHKTCNYDYRRKVRAIYMKFKNDKLLQGQAARGNLTVEDILAF